MGKTIKRVLVELDDAQVQMLDELVNEDGFFSQSNALRMGLMNLYKSLHKDYLEARTKKKETLEEKAARKAKEEHIKKETKEKLKRTARDEQLHEIAEQLGAELTDNEANWYFYNYQIKDGNIIREDKRTTPYDNLHEGMIEAQIKWWDRPEATLEERQKQLQELKKKK